MNSSDKRWALWGVREWLDQDKVSGPFLVNEERELLALFSSEGSAQDYVVRSTLAKPRPRRGFTPAKVFRKWSLLHRYARAEVERYYPDNVPLDPTVPE